MLTLGLMIALGLTTITGERACFTPAWYAVSPGLQGAVCKYSPAAGATRILAARIDPKQWSIRVADRHTGLPAGGATADQVCGTAGAAINASFFNMTDQTPIGLLIVDGKKRYPAHTAEGMYGGWGVLVVRQHVPSIVVGLKNIPKDAEYVLQCGPPLVVGGVIPPSFKHPLAARRAAVGMDAAGNVLFIASDGLLTFTQWAGILRDQFGCVDALNLDGGPSVQLAIHGNICGDVPGGWTTPIFLLAEPMPTQ